MKIAIITTKFMEEFVRDTLSKIKPRCETQIFVYRDFVHVGELYLEIENDFDGFLVSGPVPKEAILKHAHGIKKPLASFGTDLQCYYEIFFRVLYEQNDIGLERGYFDLLEWTDNPAPMSEYLAQGTFGKLMDQVYENTSLYGLSEISAMERKILNKHISLWNQGKIDYSVTRFGSIMPQLQEAGVKVYFVYPHIDLIRNALDGLIKDATLNILWGNQLAIIYVTIRQEPNISSEDLEKQYTHLERILSEYNQESLTGFVIQRGENYIHIFSHFKEIRSITDGFQTCSLKTFIRKKFGFPVCIGYGLGKDVSHAMLNAISANRESCSNPNGYSFLINERSEIVGPLREGKAITISTTVTPYIQQISEKVNLSTMTVQRILSALARLGSEQVTSQSLASTLNITVRSANRLLSNLLKYGEAEILYEKQNATKGRPERVYRIFLKNE